MNDTAFNDDSEINPFSEEEIDPEQSNSNLNDSNNNNDNNNTSFHLDRPSEPSPYHIDEPLSETVVLNDDEQLIRKQEERQAEILRRRRESLESKPPKDAIKIVDALKTSEGAGASFIVYCIRFEGSETRRRYSDFYSLRQALTSLYPCFIVPPLPPKNSLSSYAIAGGNTTKAKEDAALINRRRRMLSVFLNRCLAHKALGVDKTFRKFLEPNVSWQEVLHSPPVTSVPKNQLRGASSNPTDPVLSALFASLPMPTSSAPLQIPDQRFLDSEVFTQKFSSHLSGSLEKVNRRLMKRWTEAAADWGEMGGGMNGFALRMGEEGNGGLELATEKVGMAVDGGYTTTNAMLQGWERSFTEPLAEYTQFSAIIKSLLRYRHLKHLQYEMTRELLESKRHALEDLERSELEAQRLEQALAKVRIGSSRGGEEGATTEEARAPLAPLPPRKSGGGLLGALSHTFQGIVDADPETTRRNSISKTRESINQLDEALKALTTDLRFASHTIQADLDRFQRQKVADIREMCLEFSTFHREWAAKNLAFWEDAKASIEAIESDPLV